MPTMYKLVSIQEDSSWATHNGMKWAIGKTNEAKGKGTKMCTDQVLHCYASPEQAVLFNPIHANIQNPILLEIECSDIVNSDGLKYACKKQTPKRTVCLPVVSLNQRVAFAIKTALLVYRDASFVVWAENWLSGKDRSAAAALSAKSAAWSAALSAKSAAWSAAWSALSAAWSALSAAKSAAWSAESAALSAKSAESAALSAESFKEILSWVMENIT